MCRASPLLVEPLLAVGLLELVLGCDPDKVANPMRAANIVARVGVMPSGLRSIRLFTLPATVDVFPSQSSDRCIAQNHNGETP